MEVFKAATAPQAPAQQATPVSQEAPQTSNDVVRNILKGGQTETKPTVPSQEPPKVNVSMDEVKDPIARSILEKKLREANEGISKTFGDLGTEKAKLLKERDTIQQELNQYKNKTYTPQDIQSMLQRQDFIQAAQQLQQQMAPPQWEGTTEEWSSLNDSEKRQFQSVVNQQSQLTQQMNTMLQSQIDTNLRTKYPDYDPKPVDSFMMRAQNGQLSQEEIREAVHMYLNGPRYIKQAYEYAVQDKATTLQEKMNGSTMNGINTTTTEERPTPILGERSSAFASRLMNWNLARIRQSQSQH